MTELFGSFTPYAIILLVFFLVFGFVGWVGKRQVLSLADQKKVTAFRQILVVGYGGLFLALCLIYYLGNLNFRPPA